MKIVKTIGFGVVATIIGVASLVAPTFAETTTPAKQAITAARCTVAEARIDKHATTIATAKENHTKVYQKVLDKVASLITNAKKAGFDTTKLEATQKTLQTEFNTYTTNATKYQSDLESAKGYACGESDGQFTTALATARTDLATLRTSADSLRDTVTTELIPEIKSYASWLKDHATTPSTKAPASSTQSNAGGTK